MNFDDQVMELFDQLLDASDPQAVLAAEDNLELQQAVQRMWRHHLCADQEAFLEKSVDFTIRDVFQPGQVLLDRFEIERHVGEGGMGEVYLAHDRTLESKVALKTIAQLLASSARIRSRFISEVQNARRITHPNVCRIYDLFKNGDAPFYVMEFVAGVPLTELPAGLTKKRRWQIAVQLAEGLQAAHSKGIAHGDFKPSNVLVKDGDPPHAIILDFGLARAFESVNDEPGAGSFDYMAPELLAGAGTSVATDVYAYGKVAQLLLPGDRLWDQCTHASPEQRPSSMEEVVRYLRRDRSRRYWIAGSLVAAAGVTSLVVLSRRQAPLRIEDGARLLVNGFQTAADLLAEARLARAMLVTALQQSPRIHTLADQDVIPMSRRLLPAGLPLSGDPLRRLVALQRARYWIEGRLTQRSDRFSLSVSVMRASDDALITQEQFGDEPSIPSLAADVAVWMRQLAGESPQSLAANPATVSAFTSAVPEALRNFYDAMDRYAMGEMAEAIPLLTEAVRLDPEFAQAHNYLSMCFASLHRYDEALPQSELALQLSAKLPERERCWIESNHYALVEDPDKALDAARRNVAYHPDEPRYLRSYSQLLSRNGATEEALRPIREAIEQSPQSELYPDVLVETLCEAGKFGEALREYEKAHAKNPKNQWLESGHWVALVGLERYAEALQCSALLHPAGYPQMRAQAAKILSGDLESAIAGLQQETAHYKVAGNALDEHWALEFLCGSYYLADRHSLAKTSLEAMTMLPALPPFVRKWQCTGFWAGRLGHAEVLKLVDARLNEVANHWPNGLTRATAAHASALSRLRERALPEAERLLLESAGSAFTIWTLFDLADFYTSVSRLDLAEEYWQKFEARRGIVLRIWFTGTVLLGWLHRALATARRGNRVASREYAGKIVSAWGGKNPETMLMQTAARLNS